MFVHLLSNASTETFPNNKLGDFSTILHNPIKFDDGLWEVGLSEIHIPFAMDTIQKKDAWLEIVTVEGDLLLIEENATNLSNYQCVIKRVDDHYQVTVPDGFLLKLKTPQCGLPEKIYGNTNYTFYGATVSPEEILSTSINVYGCAQKTETYTFQGGYFKTMQELIEAIKFSQILLSMESNRYVKCQLTSPGIVRFSEQLANVLGFREQSIQQSTIAKHTPDRFPGMNCFMVCTNFIEESFVGDARVPLLRMLPAKLDVEENATMSYECFPVQYKKVVQKDIDCIRIVLVDDTGRKLPFTDRGRVSLTLHLKHGSIHPH